MPPSTGSTAPVVKSAVSVVWLVRILFSWSLTVRVLRATVSDDVAPLIYQDGAYL